VTETGPASGIERIERAFAGHGRRAALMPYLMAGFPDDRISREVAAACAEGGADLVELGIPFTDPLADGPVIHAAATRALARGATVEGALRVCEVVAATVPVIPMVYFNAILARGPAAFCAAARDAGAAGLIVPDLPHDEAAELREACDTAGLALVPLAAPSTPPERLEELASAARGFVYTVSLAGTTGERDRLPDELEDTVARVRSASNLPVAVGFGVSTPEHAATVAGFADGVIVGSRVVRAAGDGGPDAVRAVVSELAAALA
jgi:tryptophan synthase alpha chain